MNSIPNIFSHDPSSVSDLSGLSAVDLFNAEGMRLNELFYGGNSGFSRPTSSLDTLDQEEAQQMDYLQQSLQQGQERDNSSLFQRRSDENFLATLRGADPLSSPPSGEGSPSITSRAGYSSESSSETSPDPRGARLVGEVNSTNLSDFVKTFEGWNPRAYADGRQTSIGYGTKGKAGEVISREEGERRLASELGKHRQRVIAHGREFGYNFTDNQIDALTSFDYNTGSLEKLTANGTRNLEEIAAKMPAYNKADLDRKGLKPLRGLTRRRLAEQKLFTQGY